MKYKYTYDELVHEINILTNTFDVVRLIDPCTCRVVTPDSANLAVMDIAAPYCFSLWEKEAPCINCISARAQTGCSLLTKFEYTDDQIFQVTAKPVLIAGHCFTLEMVQNVTGLVINNAYSLQKAKESIQELDRRMTQDALTQAYNCSFVREHFHYTCINADRQKTMLYCVLFHINTYDETLRSHGQTAAGSLARAAADHIRSVVTSEKPDFLARCHDDTFMMILHGMTHDHLFSEIQTLQKSALRLPILYREKKIVLSFSIIIISREPSDRTDLDQAITVLSSCRDKAISRKNSLLTYRLGDLIHTQ